MKTKIIFFDVDEEAIQRAENMNMKPPDPDTFETVLYFDIASVKVFYKNREGDIAIHTTVGTWVLPYTDRVWNVLKDKFPDD